MHTNAYEALECIRNAYKQKGENGAFTWRVTDYEELVWVTGEDGGTWDTNLPPVQQ